MKRQIFILYKSRKPILTKQYPPQFVSQVGTDGIMAPTDCSKQVGLPPSDLVVMSPLWVLERGQSPGAGQEEEGLPCFWSLGATWQPVMPWGPAAPRGSLLHSPTMEPRATARGALRLSCPEALVPKLQMGRASVWEC